MPGHPAGELRVVILAILRVLVAVALLVGILRDDAARGRIAGLVITLERLPPVGVLQDSLRDALGDPSLGVVRWDPDAGHYLDAAGEQAAPPVDGPERAALTIENDGVPMLAIVYDPALLEDPARPDSVAVLPRFDGPSRTTGSRPRSRPSWSRSPARPGPGSSPRRRSSSASGSSATSTTAPSSSSSPLPSSSGGVGGACAWIPLGAAPELAEALANASARAESRRPSASCASSPGASIRWC